MKIVDQYNSLDTVCFSHHRNIDRIKNPEKVKLRNWLHRVTTNHRLILCSSANHFTLRHENKNVPQNPKRVRSVFLNGGFDDVSP